MAPTQTVEHVFIVRHGERLDQSGDQWQADPAHGIWDPPLSTLGHQQAQKTGQALGQLLAQRKLNTPTVLVYTSPFQRCIDTTLGLIKGLEPYANKTSPPLIRMDLGLGEWMSEQFYEDVYCSAAEFMARHQESLARLQAMHYRSPQEHRLPPMTVDYSYQSYTNVFDFPESYPNMVHRFDQTRARCLQLAATQHLPKKYQAIQAPPSPPSTPSSVVVIFVTHAIGINALLDSFRNTVTRPIKTNYCCISSLQYKLASYDPLPVSSPTTTAGCSDDDDDWIDTISPTTTKRWKWVPDLIADDTHLF
ncbi:phosphoglycerate mutase-like protein [Hesseltinella vesiculosa]|uniref:Phosphoglycerate mutase-like protein n=1 Tax=Hesseltinella vesiculosa TaxID=101127 RepID=A0A1X2GSM5_9FUNG|nr:phosphoglycerate mutase-like protein [Hesseltinella vesiculosa]